MASGEETEAERFAACLRGLKERSGRSYGQLAQRLHMSTSTLHRYCSGRAVPVEYGPVERMARLCGAGPDELVRLHRLWMAADAARGKAAAEGAGAGGAAEAPGPAPASESAPAEEAPARRAGDFRSWIWPVAAVVALAVTIGVTAFVSRDPDGRTGPERQVAAAPRDVPTTSTGRASPSPSASASTDEPGGGGATSPSAPGGTRSAAPGGQPQTGEGGEPSSAAPLSWTARSHVWRGGCGHRYLIDRAPSQVPAPPAEQDARGWATALGAVHGAETIVEATVTAAGRTPVVIEEVYVRVAERREPLERSAFAMSNGCGGSLTPAAFRVDLDAARPVARPQDGYDADDGTHLPATRLPYQVAPGDPLVLRIEAQTEECDCDWYVEVRWSGGGGRGGLLRIDDGGVPFRTSGLEGRPQYEYGWDAAAWRDA